MVIRENRGLTVDIQWSLCRTNDDLPSSTAMGMDYIWITLMPIKLFIIHYIPSMTYTRNRLFSSGTYFKMLEFSLCHLGHIHIHHSYSHKTKLHLAKQKVHIECLQYDLKCCKFACLNLNASCYSEVRNSRVIISLQSGKEQENRPGECLTQLVGSGKSSQGTDKLLEVRLMMSDS